MVGMSEDTKPRYKVTEEVTISRGKLSGKTGTVVEVDEAGKKYAVRIADFGLRVVSFGAVKPKTEPSLNAGQLAQAVGDQAGQIPNEVWERLEQAAPGITEHLVLVHVEA